MTGPLRRRARSLLAVVGWLLTAGAATAVGVIAVDAVGAGIIGSAPAPLSQSQVSRALAQSSPAPSDPRPATPSPPSPGGVTKVLATEGGTIIARCTGGEATILSWSPAQGYKADDVDREPESSADIKFEAEDIEIRVRVDCPDGVPTASTRREVDNDHDHD